MMVVSSAIKVINRELMKNIAGAAAAALSFSLAAPAQSQVLQLSQGLLGNSEFVNSTCSLVRQSIAKGKDAQEISDELFDVMHRQYLEADDLARSLTVNGTFLEEPLSGASLRVEVLEMLKRVTSSCELSRLNLQNL